MAMNVASIRESLDEALQGGLFLDELLTHSTDHPERRTRVPRLLWRLPMRPFGCPHGLEQHRA